MNIAEVLRKCDLSSGLTDSEVEQLASVFHPRHAERDKVIFKEGDPGNDIYIISRGRFAVKIFSYAQPGEMEKITTLKDNDIYGEFSIIDGSPRSASIVAEEDSDFIFSERETFQRFLEDNEHIGFIIMRNVAKILTAKLRRMNFEIRNAIL